MSVSDNQCAICLEEIQKTNNCCITPCGHHFCFQCLFQSFQTNTACPLCRNELSMNTDSDEVAVVSDSEEGEYEDDSEFEDEDEDEDEEDTRVELDKVLSGFEKKGYGVKDALALLLCSSMTYDPRYSRHYRNQLEDDFDEIITDVANEKREMSDMEKEDRNVCVFAEQIQCIQFEVDMLK